MKIVKSTFSSVILLLTICSGLLISGCNSLPGDGGTSTITGKVYVHEFNASGVDYLDYYGAELHVYLTYGDGTEVNDDVKTSYDGTFHFDFLRKGSYKVFVYSDCPSCLSTGLTQAVINDVEITENNSEVTLDDVEIEKH